MRKTLSPYQLDTLKEKLAVRAEKEALTTIAREILRMYQDFIKERDSLIEFLKKQKGPKGDPFRYEDFTSSQLRLLKGEPGHSPNIEDVASVVSSRLPKIKDGNPGYTPIKGKDYFTPKEIKDIAKEAASMVVVEPGKDASIDLEGIFKLFEERLNTKKPKVKAGEIDGLDQTLHAFWNQVGRRGGYIHGSGVPSLSAGANITLTPKSDGGYTISSSGGGGVSILTTSSPINDSNVSFVFASKPTLISVNGAVYRENHGWSWNSGSLTATVNYPVGVGGDIYGIGTGSSTEHDYLLTEDGDSLMTEDGDHLIY